MVEQVPVEFVALIESIFISKTIILFSVSEKVKNIPGEDLRGCGMLPSLLMISGPLIG